jgi:hydrogenase small subunit
VNLFAGDDHVPKMDDFHLVWLEGSDCDGCTISALGDTSAGGLEALLTGRIEGLPRIRLYHRILSYESGDAFLHGLRRAASGELGPFGLIVESSVPREELAGSGSFTGMGEEEGRPITQAQWVERLARKAAFVVAWGDCAVWGGPHSLSPSPVGATGTAMHLGIDYRSALGLPVINMPGCAAPPVLMATLAALLRWMQGDGPLPELDETNRPKAAYPEVWKGAFGDWAG